MDNEGNSNQQNRVNGDNTDFDVKDIVERAEDNGLEEEKKNSPNSSVTSEIGADSNLDDEVLGNDEVEENLEERKKEKESNDGLENKAVSGSLSTDGFRSMLLTAALNSRPSSREGDRTSRPASANGSEPEKQEKLSDQNVASQTQAVEKQSEGESRASSASSSSSVVVHEKSETIFEDDAEESGSVLHFEGLGAEQIVYEGETEKMVITRDGFEQVEVVSQCCQTEWSWLQDWKLINWKMGNKQDWAENRANSRQSIKSIEDLRNVPDPVIKPRRKRKSLPSHSARQVSELTKERRKTIGSYSGRSSTRTAAMQQSSQLEKGIPRLQSRSKTSTTHKSSTSAISSLPHTPKADRDMFFQTPTVEGGSSSSSDSEYEYEFQQDPLLPSIGPPTILQYNKESENPPLGNEEPLQLSDKSPEALLCTSINSGNCMFCSEEILPFPTVEEVETITPDQLYCCPKYEQFVKAELLHRGNDAAFIRDEMIDIKPHPPYGTKAARKAAKERAAERAREREMERQKAVGSNPTNFYALTRQMKTITYSLASTKCMDEGWTVRPTSPAHSTEIEQEDPFVIEINPQQLRRHTFLERFYKNGKRFLLFLQDGSGCCYYPSGNVAVVISLTEAGKFTYIVYEDDNDSDQAHPGMLAVFEPSGYGTCYFKGGAVRMALNPFGGVLLDSQGARKKKWLWHNLKTHVHAPPFQPITFSLSRHISIRCLAQNKIVMTFNYHRCTARFNVGAKLKAVAKVNPPTVRDKYEMHLAEMKQFINILIDRSQTSMRLPHYPCPDKLPLPHRLQKVKESSKKRAQNLLPLSRPDTATATVTVN